MIVIKAFKINLLINYTRVPVKWLKCNKGKEEKKIRFGYRVKRDAQSGDKRDQMDSQGEEPGT